MTPYLYLLCNFVKPLINVFYVGVVQAYYRKAQALRELPHVKGSDKLAHEVLKEGLAKNPDNEPIQ